MPADAWIPVTVGAGLLVWWLWLGRDPSPGSIVPRWNPPPDLTPGLAGTLVDQRADVADILATVLDLARRGWLTIREIHPSGVPAEGRGVPLIKDILSRVDLWETEWEFARTEKPIEELAAHEGAVMTALFAGRERVGASALSRSLHERLPGLFASLYDGLERRGFFLTRPDHVRRDFYLLAAGFGAAAGLAHGLGAGLERVVALAASGGVVALFAPVMPASTPSGARARAAALGVAEYLRRAAREEIEARHGDERTPERFDALLPWAIALGVTDLWLEEFRGMLPEERPWFVVEGPAGEALEVQIGAFCAVATALLEGRER
ncbi:MAG: DUF2207 domain-containing protein [Gemmatimonadota bacterium]|nr:DUF2207 domain-containing protein [Gemmatimonadota bacterium]